MIVKKNLFFGKELSTFFVIHYRMTKRCKKVQPEFYCEKCDYTTSRKSSLERHFLTAKHLMDDKKVQKGARLENSDGEKFVCECGKSYKFRQGLFKHKKICLSDSNKELIEIVKYQMEESKEIRSFMKEQQKMLEDQHNQIKRLSEESLFPKQIINNNCYQRTTNKFNLNFFLNEQCKDALNLGDFINSVTIQMQDLENTGKVGYVEGVSNVILKRLKELDIYQRPMHCSDLKREIMYVKNENKWTRDDQEIYLKNAIDQIGQKQIKGIPQWVSEHPECTNLNSNKNETYMNLLANCLTDENENEHMKNVKKVVSKLAKEVPINKTDE